MRMSVQHGFSSRQAFTLVEVMVTILIIVVLMGLLLPAVAMVRNSVNRGVAENVVTGIHMAMEVYFQEEPRKRLPPVEATDGDLKTNMVVAGALRTLDLLRTKGLEWRTDQVDPVSGGLLDPWARPYQYRLDDNMDGTADRPANRTDWNGKDREPYAYIWSYGKPKANDTLPANSDGWIYKKIQP